MLKIFDGTETFTNFSRVFGILADLLPLSISVRKKLTELQLFSAFAFLIFSLVYFKTDGLKYPTPPTQTAEVSANSSMAFTCALPIQA